VTDTSSTTGTSAGTGTDSPVAPTQLAKIVADDGDNNDYFGWSTALSADGTTALVGALRDEDPNGTSSGSVYVFTDSGDAWSQQAKLSADDGDDSDRFGSSVAVSDDGTTALVGARTDEDPHEPAAGSAYVFSESGGAWSQQTKLSADDGEINDAFGDQVALSADGAVGLVAAPVAGTTVTDAAGAVYVFTDSDGSWNQQAKLAADDGDDGDSFGTATALSDDGEIAVVGAPQDEDPHGEGSGSAYVFTDSGDAWSQQAKLSGDDGDDGDTLGSSAALTGDGTTALVGAQNDEDPNGEAAGAAYVFTASGGAWSQQAKLSADDGDGNDGLGASVALSEDGTEAIVGAWNDEDPNDEGAGAVYLFTGSSGSWSEDTKLSADDGDDNDGLGVSVALDDGATALVGAHKDEDPHSNFAGSAYIFNV